MTGEWKKKKKNFDFFLDFEGIQNMIDDMMGGFFDDDFAVKPKKRLVMGFNIKTGKDGKPVIERFGNVNANGGKPMVSESRAPLVDMIESEKDITITAELPGVEKKDIEFTLPEKNIATVNVKGERSFYKEIKLPISIKKGSAKAEFKNGILEVHLEKEKPSKPRRKEGEVQIG